MVLNIWSDRQIANNMDENNNIKAAQQPDIDALMAKVLCGDCTPQEYDCFSSWLAADESNRAEFHKVRSYWNADISDRFDIDTGKELERLMKRVRSSRSSKRKSFFNYIVKASVIAAVLSIGVFAGWSLAQNTKEISHQYSLVTGDSISSFVLPDGSKIHLNKDSRLDYSASFGQKERRVHLVGEAYFEVERMEDCLFVVDLDGAGITVKGTTFDAFNYKSGGVKGAALVSGMIEFNSGSQNIVLSPSKKVVFDSKVNNLTVSEFEPALLTAWKDRLFRYKSLNIYELSERLMDVYGICVVPQAGVFDDARYSGALDTGLPASQIMDIIAAQTGAEWKKVNDIYHLTKPN